MYSSISGPFSVNHAPSSAICSCTHGSTFAASSASTSWNRTNRFAADSWIPGPCSAHHAPIPRSSSLKYSSAGSISGGTRSLSVSSPDSSPVTVSNSPDSVWPSAWNAAVIAGPYRSTISAAHCANSVSTGSSASPIEIFSVSSVPSSASICPANVLAFAAACSWIPAAFAVAVAIAFQPSVPSANNVCSAFIPYVPASVCTVAFRCSCVIPAIAACRSPMISGRLRIVPVASYIEIPSACHVSTTSSVSRIIFVSALFNAVPASAPLIPRVLRIASALFRSSSPIPNAAAVGPTLRIASARSLTSATDASAACTRLLSASLTNWARSSSVSNSAPNVAKATAAKSEACTISSSLAAARSIDARRAPPSSAVPSRYPFRSPKISADVKPALYKPVMLSAAPEALTPSRLVSPPTAIAASCITSSDSPAPAAAMLSVAIWL